MAVLKCSGLIDQGKNTSLRGENYHRYPGAGGENILVREFEKHLRNTALKV